MNPSESPMVLVGVLGPPGMFDRLFIGCRPIPHANPSALVTFRCFPSTVRWLRLYVLVIASLQLSSSTPFDFGLFNCSWTD